LTEGLKYLIRLITITINISNMKIKSFFLGLTALVFLNACNTDEVTSTSTTSSTVPALFSSKFTSAVTLSSNGTTLTAKSKGVPDHATPYWGTGNTLYEAQTTGQVVNPGSLQSQTFVMSIPIAPVAASSKEETSLGPIGMALNGVAIFNDREGGNVPVEAGTLKSFDRGGAHSGPGGLYHYHFNGDFTSKDDAKLIGWLRDGFAIYGRKCSSTGATATDLDANGGHTTTTTEIATATYHYHCSNVNYMNSGFYILKSGSYHGTKGTFTF
jgi:YHYH protein